MHPTMARKLVNIYYMVGGSTSTTTMFTSFYLDNASPNNQSEPDDIFYNIPLKYCARNIFQKTPEILATLSSADYSIYTINYYESSRNNTTVWDGHGYLSWLLRDDDATILAKRRNARDPNERDYLEAYITLQPAPPLHKDDFVRQLDRFDHPRQNSLHDELRVPQRRKRQHDDGDDHPMNSAPVMSPYTEYPGQAGRAPSPYDSPASVPHHPPSDITQPSESSSPRQNAAKTLFSLSAPPTPSSGSPLPALPPISSNGGSNGNGVGNGSNYQYNSNPSYGRVPPPPLIHPATVNNGNQQRSNSFSNPPPPLPSLYQSITSPAFTTGGSQHTINQTRFVPPLSSPKPLTNNSDRHFDPSRNGTNGYPPLNPSSPRRPSISGIVSFNNVRQGSPPDVDISPSPRKDGGRPSISNGTGGNKRPRASFACESCHRKKIKCQGGTPCSQCAKYQIECVKRTMAPTAVGTDVGSLEERLRRTEDLVARFIVPNTPTTPTATTSPSLSPLNIKDDQIKSGISDTNSNPRERDSSRSRSPSSSDSEHNDGNNIMPNGHSSSTEQRVSELEKKVNMSIPPSIRVMAAPPRERGERPMEDIKMETEKMEVVMNRERSHEGETKDRREDRDPTPIQDNRMMISVEGSRVVSPVRD